MPNPILQSLIEELLDIGWKSGVAGSMETKKIRDEYCTKLEAFIEDVIGQDDEENLVNGETKRVWFVRGMNELRAEQRSRLRGTKCLI